MTNFLFCDSVWDQKGPCEAERKGLILMFSSEQRFAGSTPSTQADAGKEQTLEEDIDFPQGQQHLGFLAS